MTCTAVCQLTVAHVRLRLDADDRPPVGHGFVPVLDDILNALIWKWPGFHTQILPKSSDGRRVGWISGDAQRAHVVPINLRRKRAPLTDHVNGPHHGGIR